MHVDTSADLDAGCQTTYTDKYLDSTCLFISCTPACIILSGLFVVFCNFDIWDVKIKINHADK